MDIKEDLQVLINETLQNRASGIFLKRASRTISESAEDKESLAAAADKVGKMVALFIDEDLAKKVVWDLLSRIHESGSRRTEHLGKREVETGSGKQPGGIISR